MPQIYQPVVEELWIGAAGIVEIMEERKINNENHKQCLLTLLVNFFANVIHIHALEHSARIFERANHKLADT